MTFLTLRGVAAYRQREKHNVPLSCKTAAFTELTRLKVKPII